jgi:hypothetical protein
MDVHKIIANYYSSMDRTHPANHLQNPITFLLMGTLRIVKIKTANVASIHI